MNDAPGGVGTRALRKALALAIVVAALWFMYETGGFLRVLSFSLAAASAFALIWAIREFCR